MIRKDPSEHDLPSPVEYIECDGCGDFFHPDRIKRNQELDEMFPNCDLFLCQHCTDLEQQDQYNDHQRHAYF